MKAATKPAAPLLSQPRVQRVLYPVLIGVVLVALWQWMVVAMDLPPYLVPSPWLMMQTLVTDWAPLGSALLVTLKITVLSFALATMGVTCSSTAYGKRAVSMRLLCTNRNEISTPATVASANDSTVIFSVTRSALPSGAQSVTSVCIISQGEGTR